MRATTISLVWAILACLSTIAHATEKARMKIPSIAFNELSNHLGNDGDASSGEQFRRSMLEDGILTVNDIPGFASLRRRVMPGVSACGANATSARVTNFSDGTSRRTVAAITNGFQSSEALNLIYDAANEASCSEDLLADVDSFRELVSSVSRAFVARLGESFPSKDGSPMLQSADPASDPFDDISSLVAAGDHLEHFHAYSRGDRSPSGDNTASSETIDLHADQGMFIMSTPGIVVDLSQTPPATVNDESPGSFLIERRDGTIVECDFGFDDDVLVIMLGDGIDAIVNPKMPDGVVLRSAPHAMRMPDLSSGLARSWYGRMFLPPSNAVHDESTGISYGQMREMAIDSVRAGGGSHFTKDASNHLSYNSGNLHLDKDGTGEKKIQFNNQTSGLMWGDGYSRIVDNGNLREVESVVVAALGPKPLLEGLELRELVAVDLPRPEDPPEVGGVHVFCASVVPHLERYRGLSLTHIFLFVIKMTTKNDNQSETGK
jgi:hypothetical protein